MAGDVVLLLLNLASTISITVDSSSRGSKHAPLSQLDRCEYHLTAAGVHPLTPPPLPAPLRPFSRPRIGCLPLSPCGVGFG